MGLWGAEAGWPRLMLSWGCGWVGGPQPASALLCVYACVCVCVHVRKFPDAAQSITWPLWGRLRVRLTGWLGREGAGPQEHSRAGGTQAGENQA